MTDPHSSRVLILDFGSQYTQLIARRVREANVYSEIHPFDMAPEAITAFRPGAIILSGSPESVTEVNGYRAPQQVFSMNVPVLGICYGMQCMAEQLGGKVEPGAKREFGHAVVRARGHSNLLRDIQDESNAEGHGLLKVWMSHGDRVAALPPGFKVIASTDNAPIAGMADEAHGLYGVQFHPEVTQTRQGAAILKRFLHDIAGCKPSWTTANIREQAIESVRARVGRDQVLLALSGGVDSSVVAALLHAAIGDQLTCVFVDTGLLRLNEVEQVMDTFARHMGVDVRLVNAGQRFLAALRGVEDPEEKRRIIGREFIAVFDEEAHRLQGIRWLAQGTIYPDVIESAAGSGKSHVIKSHHNVGGLPEQMKLRLLEPLRELFKDEVRRLGIDLGLPREMVYRHPFPGPGLGVRILAEVKKEYADCLRQADAIFIDELRRAELYDQVSQAFAVFLPVRSVGVKGDARAYEYVIALRAVETIDFMTAKWSHLPHEFLEQVSNRILNEVPGISRVTYDISSKPPATIEWE
jgi:GMP synthase (glutamine-hydrolysing)